MPLVQVNLTATLPKPPSASAQSVTVKAAYLVGSQVSFSDDNSTVEFSGVVWASDESAAQLAARKFLDEFCGPVAVVKVTSTVNE